ncbi:MAG: helix-turn-helix transcriptional regulator [Leptolyngbya sp.]|nr:MAG: helix-turn-helix transcriptional regulator [Leptolyngbya sp.]
MASIPLLIKDDIKRLSAPNQSASRRISPVNRAFTAVAQEVVGLLKPSHSFQPDTINPTETTICGRPETIMIRAIEPEYRQAIAIEPLTERELEVLQLIVEGHNNSTIAGKSCSPSLFGNGRWSLTDCKSSRLVKFIHCCG